MNGIQFQFNFKFNSNILFNVNNARSAALATHLQLHGDSRILHLDGVCLCVRMHVVRQAPQVASPLLFPKASLRPEHMHMC